MDVVHELESSDLGTTHGIHCERLVTANGDELNVDAAGC